VKRFLSEAAGGFLGVLLIADEGVRERLFIRNHVFRDLRPEENIVDILLQHQRDRVLL
jgi:hypothetical protein